MTKEELRVEERYTWIAYEEACKAVCDPKCPDVAAAIRERERAYEIWGRMDRWLKEVTRS